MYRRLIVPVDGSDASMKGLRHAVGLAQDQRAQLTILNVVDDLVMAPIMGEPGGMGDFGRVIETIRAEGRKALDKALALAEKSDVESVTRQVDSRGRAVSDVILAETRRARADLIVMGTHGRRGLNRLLLGSDAASVLRDAPVPVLLVRGTGLKRTAAPRTRTPARRSASKR